MDEGLQVGVLLLRLRLIPPDDRIEAGHDLEMLGRAAVFRHPSLEILAEILAHLKRIERREDALRGPRGKLLAGFRRSRLEQNRMPLRRASDVERPAHREI